jgi:hypothetical protein
MKTYIYALAAGALLATSADALVIGNLVTPPAAVTPPVCPGAAPSVAPIWPPNHKMVAINITLVSDQSGVARLITINSIMQDEPVEVAGSGNTAPDGTGVGTSTAFVRAERAGPGTGRLYLISFKAENSAGLCTGSVTTFVPHDQGQGFIPVDTGVWVDSTVVL